MAEVDGRVVGWAYLTSSERELCLDQIAVRPEFQQRGVGSTMLQRIIDDAIAAGEHSIVLNTQRDLV